MDSRNNNRKNYNLMNLMNNLYKIISNDQTINVKSLIVPKFKYYNFLENVLIDKLNIKNKN